MVEPLNIRELGNNLLLTMDDGSTRTALRLPGELWVLQAPADDPAPEPPAGDTFEFPAPLSEVTYEFRPPSRPTHAGMDFSGANSNYGKDMKAAGPGTVWKAGVHGGYGHTVIIDHGKGRFTLYGHMVTDSYTVRVGQQVVKGQKLGLVNNTGSSFGSHIHFETHEGGYKWYDSAVNPRQALPRWNANP